MDVITTSLEALIQRATSNQNQCPDTAAIDAFCGLVNREPQCAQVAAKFITAKAHSLQEWEALQALHVLDACMEKCGSNFHAEVGKFRFLNELIKLVSPKYLGAHTPQPVRRRVLEMMQSWTVRYSKEPKIKEAYEMLKKQGVVKEEDRIGGTDLYSSITRSGCTSASTSSPSCPTGVVTPSRPNSIFQDEEKSRLLQKLLQSKNPDDLQAANRLIKTMVKEDERRVEQKVRQVTELEAVHNNARLLGEMLDSYRPDSSPAQDLELINELHTSCMRLRPTIFKLASQVHTEESLFNEVLAANDELGEVFDKYTKLIVQGKSVGEGDNNGSSLLDLSTPSEESLPTPVSLVNEHLSSLGIADMITSINSVTASANKIGTGVQNVLQQQTSNEQQTKSDYSALDDIFSSQLPPPVSERESATLMNACTTAGGRFAAVGTVLSGNTSVNQPSNKLKALEELDILGETLLKENLPQSAKTSKNGTKVPMNQLYMLSEKQPAGSLVLTGASSPTMSPSKWKEPATSVLTANAPQDDTGQGQDELLLFSDANTDSDDAVLENGISNVNTSDVTTVTVTPTAPPNHNDLKEQLVKPLADINVSLESIKPGSIPPRTLVNEKNGITVVLHVSASRPRPDVTVFVVTTTNNNSSTLTNYLFQPVVPKSCRLRLQRPTASELPPHNPFLPPSVISQVMLIASPTPDPIKLKYVVSYTMDEETMTEMGEVADLALTAL